jgi:hypothetical protein
MADVETRVPPPRYRQLLTREDEMSDNAQPSAELKALDRLVGTWSVSGGAEGTVRYEWMPGRFFLLQHVELTQFGQPVTGLEVIGNLHPFGEPVGADGGASSLRYRPTAGASQVFR